MGEDAQKTLFHPFEAGLVELPDARGRVLCFGARAGFSPPPGFAGRLAVAQGFRPDYLALAAAGHAVTPGPEGDGHAMALVLCGRHRGQNEAWIGEALARTRPGGALVVAGGRSDGIDSLRRRVARALTLAGHASKHHGVAFWLMRPEDAALAASGLAAAVPAATVDGRFRTAPGMFSHDRIDPGSRLLAAHLPGRAKGRVADFGAGWGFLAAELLARDGGMTGLDLFEADHASLAAARGNLASPAGGPPIGFHWHDLVAEPVPRRYDLVVMNPPFHRGRAAEPAIGEAMIRTASGALLPGGRLAMVANAGLPYERTLTAQFGRFEEVARADGFKVLTARR